MYFAATPQITIETEGDWRQLWPSGALLFTRARFALFEGLAALVRRRSVRRLWIPAYLCCPVLEAAAAAGLAVALYDIDETLAPRLATIEPEAGDALLVVHYFGLVAPPARLRTFCAEHSLPLVEDCAHALPDPGGHGAGSVGDIAVFSLRKLGPVPGGGLLVVGDARVRRISAAPPPRLMPDGRTLGRLAIMLAERAAEASGFNPMRAKNRLPVLDASHTTGRASSSMERNEYANSPRPSYLVRSMFDRTAWRRVIDRRRDAYRRLADHLARVRELELVVPEPSRESVPESFPVFVAEPREIAVRLRRHGVEAMRWPGSEQFAFDRETFPGAAMWLERSVCLPLGTSLTPERVAALAAAVRDAVTTSAPTPAPVARVA
ncbi:MAG: DegT/DnrJ/EryC1/StrS family aminotransferase [Candidatus Rokubacteria bacterium]|nr:DegT/DnrJ/EryC1/StrS family aminotransferase [Candidatus Rokubacteria bacterium]